MTQKGETHASAKLDADKVRAIRALYRGNGKPSMAEIAATFGCSAVAVYKVVRRKSWKHVP